MNIRLGYACISKTLAITSSHTITYTNYELLENKKEKLVELTNKNLNNLEEILKYNIKNNIHFYRMSSKIIPLATHPNVNLNLLSIFKDKLEHIGNIIKENNLRVDIHLDEYCVLNSTNPNIVSSTINIIKFYKNMLKAMNIKSYMILHVGSSAFGIEKSITRFVNNFKKLDKESQKMIILENDDKVFKIEDVLKICNSLNIPMVLDYHHYKCNRVEQLENYIKEIINTWNGKTPKMHISSKKNNKEFRSHHDYININDFIELISILKKENIDIDIMIEAKQKDMALFKLIRELKYKDYKLIDETTINIE